MDGQLNEIEAKLEAMKIGLDESFKFHCTMCGECCIHREDILLSPKDIYNIAKELKLSTADLFNQYCETYIGYDSGVPVVRLEPRGAAKRCPLLKNKKCIVHRAKPIICAMYPIGRCLIATGLKEDIGDSTQYKLQYIFNSPECGDGSETHTVREYLESFGIPVEDGFFMKWYQVILDMGNFLRKIEEVVDMETMEFVWKTVFVGIYLHYDVAQEFIPQFEDNVKNLFDALYSTFTDEDSND